MAWREGNGPSLRCSEVRMKMGVFRRGLARVALSGLALGFALLAALAWFSATVIDRAVEDLHAATEVASTWDYVLRCVTNETEEMNDYLRAPEERAVQPVTSAIGSARSSLAWLAARGRPESARQLALVSGSYDQFTDNLKAIVADAGKASESDRMIMVDEATLTAASLRKQLNSQVKLERVHLILILKAAKLDHQRLRTATYVVLGVDLVLLLVCAKMLLSYQRRIKSHAERSHHRSLHDALTGLPNRAGLEERMAAMVADSTDKAESFAVLMLDLDGFKGINDRLGHHHGDLLLVWVAQQLARIVRAGDTAIRLGGDEFAILTKISDRNQIANLTDRIQAAITEPTVLDGEPVRVGASIGVALCPEHSGDAHELLRFADAAMYFAKRNRLGMAMHATDAPGPASGRRPIRVLNQAG
jgi:diguanylate cyclase (GGDEF)-like protein